MSFASEFKQSLFYTFLFIAIMVLLLIPLDQFIGLPEFLWFLENKSIISYFNEHIEFLFSLIPMIGLVMLIVIVWRKK